MVRPVIGALALALALAGCGGDPKADPTPTPSTPVTTTVSTTPAPPVMPEAAKANTKAGAIAFVKYYVQLINHAQATGDVASLKAVEDAGCESCSAGRDALNEIYEAGGMIQGGQLSFRVSTSQPSQRYRGWVVSGVLRFAPQSVTKSARSAAQNLTGGVTPANAFVSMANDTDEWRVMDWTRGS